MVTNIRQAIAIQNRRKMAKKYGFAKAVRRFLLSEYGTDYQKYRNQMPVAWPTKKKAA